MVHGLGGRYASALFDLARTENQADEVETSLARLKEALGESKDLNTLISSPLLDREQASKGMMAVAQKMKLDALTVKFLGVLSKNRRLAALPLIIRNYQQLAAEARGEITADVTSAHALTKDQEGAVKTVLRARFKRDVALNTKIDPDILGGLIVQVGSRLIDSSLKTKLDNIGRAMKGA
ncbi:F0F1 ATP synthase subunit delta [Pacificimonas sp. WHA3]|uniref:ATP synthase subunit delta n=1 Tax=Pacificimonas pallii TaxID=2827236 RepID=A0ABS6SIL4_9SPHN|nr:F0F1 ATP synthase subunit delta [Pacificimonas pallii]MBV7257702.1 F0F1 ATP synthase subunit delta [Pacificimonas pallii]